MFNGVCYYLALMRYTTKLTCGRERTTNYANYVTIHGIDIPYILSDVSECYLK